MRRAVRVYIGKGALAHSPTECAGALAAHCGALAHWLHSRSVAFSAQIFTRVVNPARRRPGLPHSLHGSAMG